MAQSAEALVREAIAARRLIEFRLHGLLRKAEPHLLGRYHGALQLLLFQVGGESRSGDLPDWRRADLREIRELRMTEETFPGPRVASSRHTQWDVVLARVE